MAALERLASVEIHCDPQLEAEVRDDIIKNLSGAVLTNQGKYLWLGTDEFASIERFTRVDGNEGIFSDHRQFHFRDFITGFEDNQGEVDIEGLDYHDGYLWIVGSHSSKRKKVKVESDKFQLKGKELKQIERQANRYLLARVPINDEGELEQTSPKRAWLTREGSHNSLTKALLTDEYLSLSQSVGSGVSGISDESLLYLPSKENGLDIEGLAASGNRILLGLRGPVLRGIAILLEIEVEEGASQELKLKPIGNDGKYYKRHFVDLDGLGVRELCWQNDGTTLLILAGPTMDLDGSLRLFRLDAPFSLSDDSFSGQKNGQLDYLGEIPHGRKSDRAEGLALYDQSGSVLVVYDSPAKERLILDQHNDIIGVRCDVFSYA
jgi:hypothetical protein